MTWLLAYLLFGFVLEFIAIVALVKEIRPIKDWKIELIAILVWPLTILMAAIHALHEKKKA